MSFLGNDWNGRNNLTKVGTIPSSRAGSCSWGTILLSREQTEWNKQNGTNRMEQTEWNKQNGTNRREQTEWNKHNEKKQNGTNRIEQREWNKQNGTNRMEQTE